MNKEIKHEKCNRCKCHRLPEEFLNEKGRRLKTCVKCRESAKKHRTKYREIILKKKKEAYDKDPQRFREANKKSRQKYKDEMNFKKRCKYHNDEETRKYYLKHREKYYQQNKNKCLKYQIKYRQENKEKIAKINKEYREKNREKILKKSLVRSKQRDVKDKRNERARIRRKNDTCFKLIDNVGARIRQCLKANKNKRSIEYLGTTIEEYKKYLESKFKTAMTWKNYGEWHIDHITPLKYKEGGKAPDLEEVIRRLHYTNTQPLWATENISKGNRFIG